MQTPALASTLQIVILTISSIMSTAVSPGLKQLASPEGVGDGGGNSDAYQVKGPFDGSKCKGNHGPGSYTAEQIVKSWTHYSGGWYFDPVTGPALKAVLAHCKSGDDGYTHDPIDSGDNTLAALCSGKGSSASCCKGSFCNIGTQFVNSSFGSYAVFQPC